MVFELITICCYGILGPDLDLNKLKRTAKMFIVKFNRDEIEKYVAAITVSHRGLLNLGKRVRNG